MMGILPFDLLLTTMKRSYCVALKRRILREIFSALEGDLKLMGYGYIEIKKLIR